MSDNWVVQNLTNSLDTWNEKLGEVWTLLTQSPQAFKGGAVWSVIVNIYGTLQAIGYALLVLFFVAGVIKTCGSFAEVKRPEHALRLFFRFALSKAAITYKQDQYKQHSSAKNQPALLSSLPPFPCDISPVILFTGGCTWCRLGCWSGLFVVHRGFSNPRERAAGLYNLPPCHANRVKRKGFTCPCASC